MIPTQTPTRRRDAFDPHRQYHVVKTGHVAGKLFQAGEIFDKSVVDVRKLKMMYEGRWLTMASLEDAPRVEPHKPAALNKPDFQALTAPELRLWLSAHNATPPRARVSHETLRHMAEAKWAELLKDVVAV